MSDEARFPIQRETLEHLRQDMEQAKDLYEGAREAYLQELERYSDFAAPPVAQAKVMYDYSREVYHGALQRFNGLVLRGEIPRTAKAG